MNKKERVISAIQLKQVDKIPTSYRASELLTKKIMVYLGFENPGNIDNWYTEFLETLGSDYWSSGSKIDKFSNFIPKFKGPLPEKPYIDDGTYFYTIGIKSRPGKMYGFNIDYPNVGIDPPLKDLEHHSEIKSGFLTSKLDLFDFNLMFNKYRNISHKEIDSNSQDIVSIGTLSSIFMICCYLRGMDNFLIDLVFNTKMAEHLINEVGDFCLEFNRRELDVMKGKAIYYGTWDDVAGQNGMMFDPKLFRKYFLPIYKKLIENNKKCGLFFGWHVCGSVHEVMPDMIEAGIDVFDVVQTSAKDMEIEKIFKLYGNKVCLHGALDVQKLLVEKNAKQVKEEVKKIKDLWGNKGGIILAPSHETLPDTPVENIIAIYEEINQSGD